MATTIKILAAKDFLEVTTDGLLDLATSRKLLAAIASAMEGDADYELLVDFRDAHSKLQIADIYQLAGEVSRNLDAFRSKMAVLVVPGVSFEQARFFETCSLNRGCLVSAFTDYEEAMRWLLTTTEVPATSPDDGAGVP